MNHITINRDAALKVNVSLWDTPSNIRLRIVDALKLPEDWVYVESDIFDSNVVVLTLPILISKHLEDSESLVELQKENALKFPNVSPEDYVILWYF